jgi:hypothetical protein
VNLAVLIPLSSVRKIVIEQLPAEIPAGTARMAMDWLSIYRSVYAASTALVPPLGVGQESLRHCVVGARSMPDRRPVRTVPNWRKRQPDTGFDFLREGDRPTPSFLCRFMDVAG